GAHVTERGRGGNRSSLSETGERLLVAVSGDAVAPQQPVGKLRLSLAEQLEIEIPDPFDRLHPVMRPPLLAHDLLKPRGRRIADCGVRGGGDPSGKGQQTAAKRDNQLIRGLNVALGRRRGPAAKLVLAEGP